MKKHYLIRIAICLIAVLSFTNIIAQNIPPTAEIDNSFYNRMNYVFSPLEKNRVPYGLLRDFAMEFSDLERYNGSLNDSNYVDYGDFFDIYQTLFTSRIHSNASAFTNPIVADSLWYLQRTTNVITIGGLCYGYSYFRDDAYSSGLLTVNNDQIYDSYINGIWQNPYQTGLSVAFAPAIPNHQGRNISILIPSAAWFTNQQVSNIQIDAGNGNGYQNITIGQSLSVFYPDSGLKTLNFKVTLSSSQVLYSHSQIHIANAVNPSSDTPPSQLQTFSLAVNGPQEVESVQEFEGKKAKGFITIRYASPNDRVLRRPLIIAEGYDPGNILAPEEEFGMNDIGQFVREIATLDPNSLQQLLLNNPQYDIVYVDWKKGTDNLFRNAKLLKTIIALVNQNKVAVNGVIQDNVIIGQSMGGVITRIALREMENENIDHQTRLFISQDSPQQGANVPIAYQYMGRHFRNIYISAGAVALGAELFQLIRGGLSPLKALSLANEPASKQMLINYISDFGTLRNIHHDEFYESLRTLGYPTQCRMVAISNGSECATSQGFNPGESILEVQGKVQTRFLGDVGFSVLSYYASPYFPFSRIFKLGILPGRNEIIANINLKSIANGGGNEVYYCDIIYRKKLFYFLNIDVTLAHKEKNADSGMIPIDSYPGGFLNPLANFTTTSYTNWFFKYNINVSANRAFNFIPTTSSLDIGRGLTALNSTDYLTVYSSINPPAAPKQTPFANFIVARQNNNSINEDHISFTARNADWAGNEITSNLLSTNPPLVDCSYLCNGVLQISGLPQLCNTQENYTIPNLPFGSTVIWSILPTTGIATLTTSGNTATLTKTGDGNIQLLATVNSPCGAVNINPLNIYVGVPQITAINLSTVSGSGYWCAYSRGNYFDIELQGGQSTNGLTFQIQLLDPSTFQVFADYTVLGGNGTFALPRPSYTTYLLQARVINHPCGNSEAWFGYEMEFIDCNFNNKVSNYNVYPNPANNDLTIEYAPIEESTTEKITITSKQKDVKLFNNKGEIIVSSIIKENEVKLTLDTKNIPDGTYFLHIIEDKETVKKQIIIKH